MAMQSTGAQKFTVFIYIRTQQDDESEPEEEEN